MVMLFRIAWNLLLFDLWSKHRLLSFYKTSFFEELPKALLKDRLAEEVVHACRLSFLLVFLSLVGRDAANERLDILCHVLVHELPDLHASLYSTHLRHTVVEQDEFVSVALIAISLLDPVDSLGTVRGRIALNRELHQQVLQGYRVESVIVHDKHACLWVSMVLFKSHHAFDGSDLFVLRYVKDLVLFFFVLTVVGVFS